jgi:hypothetical protein
MSVAAATKDAPKNTTNGLVLTRSSALEHRLDRSHGQHGSFHGNTHGGLGDGRDGSIGHGTYTNLA